MTCVRFRASTFLLLIACLAGTPARAQTPAGTVLTYQGQLKENGQPLNGNANLVFDLFAAETGGESLGTVAIPNQPVSNGLFTATLDFGASPFSANEARWLGVKVNGAALAPRQRLTATPFSLATRGVFVDTSPAGVFIPARGPNNTHVLIDNSVNNGTTLWVRATPHQEDLTVLRVTGDSDGDAGGPFHFEVRASGLVRTRELEITGGGDLAEPFDVKSAEESRLPVGPGMVVVIDPTRSGALMLATGPYDRKVAGIISGANNLHPGMVMRAQGDPSADGEHPVALAGRVWCWCDASYGAVEPGDRLTTSATPGHAMKVTDHARATGAVIGKAMTRLDAGKGLVLVLVQAQ